MVQGRATCASGGHRPHPQVRFSSPDFDGETTNYDSQTRDWFLESLKPYRT